MSRIKAVITRARRIKTIDKKLADLREKVKVLQMERGQLESEACDFLKKEGIDGCKDGDFNYTRKELVVPTVKDFNKTWEYAVEHDAPELFQRRINSKAWRDHDMDVPGVGTFTKVSLSITTRR